MLSPAKNCLRPDSAFVTTFAKCSILIDPRDIFEVIVKQLHENYQLRMRKFSKDLIFRIALGKLITPQLSLILYYVNGIYRTRHQRCSVRKGFLRNFAKFTGKHLYQSLSLNKVAGDDSFSLSPFTF